MPKVVALVVIVLGFIALSAWWLESRFGPTLAVAVLLGITHLVAFAGGSLLSSSITRGSLRAVNEFAKLDAMNDRYRHQTFKAQATGESAWQKARAQMYTIDARRVDRLAQDRAKILIQNDRQARQPRDEWGWDDEEDSGEESETWG